MSASIIITSVAGELLQRLACVTYGGAWKLRYGVWILVIGCRVAFMELVSKLLMELSSQILHRFPSHITDVRVTNSLSLTAKN
jgi:hypothetical protein